MREEKAKYSSDPETRVAIAAQQPATELNRALLKMNEKHAKLYLDNADRLQRMLVAMDPHDTSFAYLLAGVCFSLVEDAFEGTFDAHPDIQWVEASRVLSAWLCDWEGRPGFSLEQRMHRRQKLCGLVQTEGVQRSRVQRSLVALLRGMDHGLTHLSQEAWPGVGVPSWILLHALTPLLGKTVDQLLLDADADQPSITKALTADWTSSKAVVLRAYELVHKIDKNKNKNQQQPHPHTL